MQKLLSRLILILLLLSPLNAGVVPQEGFGLELSGGFYGSIPSQFHEEALVMRSHATFGGTLRPIIFGFQEHSEISLGLSAFYTTHSLNYGTTSWRPALLTGLSFNYTYHFNTAFALAGEIYLMGSIDLQIREIAPLLRLSLAPTYSLGRRHQLLFSLPVSLDLRADYSSVVVTLAVAYKFDWKRGKP